VLVGEPGGRRSVRLRGILEDAAEVTARLADKREAGAPVKVVKLTAPAPPPPPHPPPPPPPAPSRPKRARAEWRAEESAQALSVSHEMFPPPRGGPRRSTWLTGAAERNPRMIGIILSTMTRFHPFQANRLIGPGGATASLPSMDRPRVQRGCRLQPFRRDPPGRLSGAVPLA